MDRAPRVDLLSTRRPFGLLVLIGLLVVKAVMLSSVLVADELPAGPLRRILAVPPAIAQAIRDSPVIATILVVLVAFLLLAALGLWRGRRWGWVIAMLVTGFFVALDIWAFSEGRANHLWMLLNAVTVVYLNQRDVREILVGGRAASQAPGEATG